MGTNVIVERRYNESTERLIRRFVKKVKRTRILETHRERTSHYIKPSIRRKNKSKKARREKERLERKLNKRK
jgi:ribosomal protein S21